MTFYICYCGNTVDNHNFKHRYEEKVKVLFDKSNNSFTLNADDFPVKNKTKCSKPNCNGDIYIHETIISGHKYEPVSYTYREIKLSLPKDTICIHEKNCKILKDHKDILTHHFKTKVIVENLQENDIVNIINPEDEDIKIIWK